MDCSSPHLPPLLAPNDSSIQKHPLTCRRRRNQMGGEDKENVEDKQRQTDTPESSSKQLQQSLFDELKNDANMCNLCADTFCRDETYGDPHLVACSQCRRKYHTFCVSQEKGEEWICGECHPLAPTLKMHHLPPESTKICKLCGANRTEKGDEGALIGPYPGIGDTSQNYFHEKCAFYSKRVVKIHQRWYRIQSAVRDSHIMRCAFCDKKGASVPCGFPKCRKIFHYPCAQVNGCCINDKESQKQYCRRHFDDLLHTPPPLVMSPPPSPKKKLKEVSNLDQEERGYKRKIQSGHSRKPLQSKN